MYQDVLKKKQMATETRRKGRFMSRPLTYVTPLYKSDLGLLSTYPLILVLRKVCGKLFKINVTLI